MMFSEVRHVKNESTVWSIVNELKALYPDSICSLDYPKPYELLFAVRLAAQCTDERVNKVTPALFARYPTLESLAEADVAEVETYIHSTGFFRAKARDIVAASQMMLSEFGGKVPDNMDDLLRLPGVGRKTANLILGDIYNTPGVVVADTHCIRISGKLGLTDGTKDPAKVEQQLRAILPPEESNNFCHRLVLHGRAVCTARKPDCANCTLRPWCDFSINPELCKTPSENSANFRTAFCCLTTVSAANAPWHGARCGTPEPETLPAPWPPCPGSYFCKTAAE